MKAGHIPFGEALLKGLAPDGGLYLPLEIPRLSGSDLKSLSRLYYPALAAEILGRLTGNEIGKDNLISICSDIYNFDVPLERIYGRNYIMRLDQGPTASFKDFAALFMGRMMQHYLSIKNQHLIILTATSGDTGSAVANAFYRLANINVIILFPAGEVTAIQRKQMTTFGENIQAVEINGKFDDCQNIVKTAFMDQSLSPYKFSSANSINIGRLLPQTVYYFWAWSRLSVKADEQIIFSVPCGNFGNLTGGLLARDMGLPVKSFIISTNENNEVPEFLKNGFYKAISPSKNCISSAMNVGHPSNLARIIAMYNGRMDEKGNIIKEPDLMRMRKDMFPVSVSDSETRETISQCYSEFKVLLEPHGAVAWNGMQSFLRQTNHYEKKKILCVSLETAHPAKFSDEIYSILNFHPVMPDSMSKTETGNEEYISLENNYNAFKDFIIKNY